MIAVGTTTTRALEDAARRGDGGSAPARARAELFIYPGFSFQVVDRLITNFHLPKSSLLMLVSAFAGTSDVLERLPRGDRAALPVLQLRGCDV